MASESVDDMKRRLDGSLSYDPRKHAARRGETVDGREVYRWRVRVEEELSGVRETDYYVSAASEEEARSLATSGDWDDCDEGRVDGLHVVWSEPVTVERVD